MAIPLPRRSLRSLVVFLCIVLGPYFFVRHISSISQADSSPSAAYSYLSGSSSKRVESERQVAERDLGDDLVFQQDDPLLIGSSKATEKGKIRMARHTFLPNGLLEVKPEGQHPIHDLIEQGERTWGRKLEQASRTLGEAVNEYRRRYGRAPPKGFDRWSVNRYLYKMQPDSPHDRWTYTQKNNVQLPDEYDQIVRLSMSLLCSLV